MGNQNERTYRRAPAKLQPPAGAQRGSIAWHPAGMAQHSTAQHSSVLHPGRKHILTVSFRDVNQHISNGCSTFFHQKRGLTLYFHQFPLILLVLEDLKINPLSYLVWFWSLKWFEMSFFSLFSLI